MFNPKLYTTPAAWRTVSFALGTALVAILASQTLTAGSAYGQSPFPVGLNTIQELGSIPKIEPEIQPVRGSSSSLLQIGQPQTRSLVPPEPLKRANMESEDARAASFAAGEDFPTQRWQLTGVDYDGPVGVLVAGRGGNETTCEPASRLAARHSRKAPSGSPSTELAPLLNEDNLIRVFHFRNSTKDWLFYDPRPAFAAANTIVDLENRTISWLKVKRDQDVTLNGKEQRVSCTNEGTASADCWNILVW